ncbi:hypothetical protein [Caballeronia sp. 15711]|uniref:hypothetical protein n=1 Tax=Caballeronia sp. 15711 TaxID=3391029 RepID=UPI0039E71A11
MSVDMFERRFRQELEKLPKFVANDQRDRYIWAADFPAWHALFSSLCLYGHSTGYRLPSFDDFFRFVKKAYTKRHPERERFSHFFEQDHLIGMTQRISAWYESGMAEMYLYVCLVEAIEDKSKAGVVLYDPRADWKLKADTIVIIQQRPLRISAYFGDQDRRPGVEAQRDSIERLRKKNTMESAHWQNAELAAMKILEIARLDHEVQVINGMRLFSLSAVNRLLVDIYATAGVKGWTFSVAD